MKTPKGAMAAAAGSRLKTIKEDTTPNIEAMGTKAKSAEIARLNLRLDSALKAEFQIISIRKKTTPERLAISLIEQFVREEGT